MTREQDNQMWQRIESASRPTPEELREAEAELQELDCEPLSQEQTERLLARAGVCTTVEPKRQRRALFAVAAAALLAIAGIAMVGGDVIHPRDPSPMLTLEWQKAIDNMHAVDATDSDWSTSITFISGYCRDALDILQDLKTDTDAAVATAASDACERLSEGIQRPATGSEMGMREAAATVADASASTDARVAATGRIEELAAIGVASVRSATEDTPGKKDVKTIYVDRLEALLER